MKRRTLFKAGALTAAASALARPAVAQSSPEVRWRLTSAFPKPLAIIIGAAEKFARCVSEATDGRFQIRVYPAGDIAPGLKAIDAVVDGTVECAQAPLYFNMDVEPSLAIGTGLPFGLNARHQQSWWVAGGGAALIDEALGKLDCIAIPIGNSGTQMGGWFRKEIRSVEDLKGLKFRIGGMGGDILARLGVERVMTAPSEIGAALEQGNIDAAEFVGPFDDERLGFHKVAKYYYYPGWWEGGAMLHLVVKRDKWDALPEQYRSVLQQAGDTTTAWMLARYDRENPAALHRLVDSGVLLKAFPKPVIEACWKAAREHYASVAENNPIFKRALASHDAFQAEALSYWRIAEHDYDTMMLDLIRR